MNFEPQRFFIGMVEFFSIILPGAVLSYVMKDEVLRLFTDAEESAAITSIEGWTVFLVISYIVGHFVFLMGAVVLDEYVYDPIVTATPNGRIDRLAKGKRLPWGLTRGLSGSLMKPGADRALRQAERIRDRVLSPLHASSAINTFQWSKAQLLLQKPEALAIVNRFEADSKFFRSFSIVLVILIVWVAWNGCAGGGDLLYCIALIGLLAILLALALWRYIDQRQKSTTQAYWYIITLEAEKRKDEQANPEEQDEATHAGGVVYQEEGGRRRYLLVSARRKPDERVLPKGHIKKGELPRHAAVREVHEEAGVWARIVKELDRVTYEAGGEHVDAVFYVMEAVKKEKPLERRQLAWLPIDEAERAATHEQTKQLLRKAESRLSVMESHGR